MVSTVRGLQLGYARPASDGFTIIEVLLFLGVSALLLVVAMASIGSNLNTNRFNDAVRSVGSYLQGRYTQVASGLSDRSDTVGCVAAGATNSSGQTPGMSDCVILGRLIVIQGDQFQERYILGFSPNIAQHDSDDTISIQELHPWVAGTDTYGGTYGVPWSIGVTNSKIAGGAPVNMLGLAIVRAPASGNVLYYAFPVSSSQPALDNSVINDAHLGKDVDMCIDDPSSGRVGHVRIGQGQGQEVITSDLLSTGACS